MILNNHTPMRTVLALAWDDRQLDVLILVLAVINSRIISSVRTGLSGTAISMSPENIYNALAYSFKLFLGFAGIMFF